MTAHPVQTAPPRQPQLLQSRGQACQSPEIYLMMLVGFSLPGVERYQGLWARGKEVTFMLMGWSELLQSLAPLLPPKRRAQLPRARTWRTWHLGPPQSFFHAGCMSHSPTSHSSFKGGQLPLGDAHSPQRHQL